MFEYYFIIKEHHFDKMALSILIAFIITYYLIPQIVKIALIINLYDTPNERRLSNRRIIPTLGGIGIFIATIITCLVINSDSNSIEINSILGISLAFAILGLKDDIIGLSARSKFVFQFLSFAYTTFFLNFRIIGLDGFLGLYELSYLTSLIITMFFCIGLVNSLNLIDGIDGLFGFISIIISISLGWIFFKNENFSYSFLNFALAGSLLAFLLFNIFGVKNKIFVGDSGTHFVGFILTLSAIKAININTVPNSIIISLFVLPIFDTIRVFAIRISSRKSPFSPDMNHIHHFILRYTGSHLISTLILITFNLLCILSVAYIPINPTITIIGFFLIFIFVPYILGNEHLRWKTNKIINYFLKLKILPIRVNFNILSLFNPVLNGTNNMKTRSVVSPLDFSLELFNSLGLTKNPFSNYAAEEEIEYLDEIYFIPKYFQPLYSDIKSGNTRFVIGARGVGKTALVIKLKKQLDKNKVFTIIIDDYGNIPLNNNSKYFLDNTIRKIITLYCSAIKNSPILLKPLNKSDKVKLTFLIENFFNPITEKEFEKYLNATSNYKSKNIGIKAYNFLLNPFNMAISLGIEIGSDFIKKSLGLSSYDTTMEYKNYLPKLQEINHTRKTVVENFDYSVYKEIIIDISRIIKKSGFEQVVILYDKVDEHKELGGETSKISTFISDILKDNNLLLNKDFGIVFSLWSELKEELSKDEGIRFDKIGHIDVTWSNNELEQIVNSRLNYLSLDPKNPIKLGDIVTEQSSLEELISISYKSPRDLLKLMSYIYYEQAIIDNRAKLFSYQAIRKGINKFIAGYEYYAMFPQKGINNDILKNIKKVLYCNKLIFKISDISQDLNISISTANSLIKSLNRFGIIKELNQTQGNAKIFEIIDPKIVWLIKNQINPWGN